MALEKKTKRLIIWCAAAFAALAATLIFVLTRREDPEPHLLTANVLLDEGFPDEALIEYETVLSLDPTNYEAAEGRLAALAGTYGLEAARNRLIADRDAHPDDPFYSFQLALYHAHHRDFYRAREQLKQAERLGLSRAWHAYGRGVIYSAAGQLADAAEEFTKAIDIDPGLGSGYVNLADTCIGLDNLEKARAILSEGTETSPKDAYRLRPRLAWLSLAEGNDILALEQLTKILQSAPKVPGCFYAAASIALALDLGEGYEPAIELPLPDQPAVPVKGFENLPLGQRWAILACSEALEYDPLPARAHYHLARCLYEAGDSQAAQRELELTAAAGTHRVPYSTAPVELYRWLGGDALAAGDYVAARNSYRTVLGSRRDDPDALYNIGLAYEREGEPSLAARGYEAATRAAPDDPRSYSGLARIHLAAGDFSQAVQYAEAAAERDPAGTSTQKMLVRAYIAGRCFEQADAVLQTLRHLVPKDPEVGILAGRLAEERGDLQAAVDAYAGVLQLGIPTATALELYYSIARLYTQESELATDRVERKRLENLSAQFTAEAANLKL
ncbi:MAG: tetratricopeptide repeat protein [bacterium]|nr:tetratricopeptide repeat protein [bacterium]